MNENPSFLRRILAAWLEVAARFGEVQTLVLMFLIYGFVIGPMAIGISVARKDLLAKRGLGETGSAWSDADTAPPDLERAKHTF